MELLIPAIMFAVVLHAVFRIFSGPAVPKFYGVSGYPEKLEEKYCLSLYRSRLYYKGQRVGYFYHNVLNSDNHRPDIIFLWEPDLAKEHKKRSEIIKLWYQMNKEHFG